MIALEEAARLVLGVTALATAVVASTAVPASEPHADTRRKSVQPYVLGPDEGEQLVHRRGGNLLIKVDPSKGSDGMALGTRQLPRGEGIAVHQHLRADEVLFVLEGTGHALLGDTRTPVGKGSAIFIPKGAWHGIQNPDQEMLLLWIVAPPGLEAFFREVGSPPGAAPKQISREDLDEIARKHGIVFRESERK